MPAAIATRDIPLRALPATLDSIGSAADPRALAFDVVLKEISVYLASQGKLSFDRGTAPDGTPWPPLKRQRSRPRDRKRNKLPSGKPQGAHKPLRDTGLLMASISARAGARGSIREVRALSLEQGTSIPYAGFHQFGTRSIPVRAFLGITDKMADRCAEFIADDVVRQLTGERRAS